MKKILKAFFLSIALLFAGLLFLNVNAADTTYSYTFTKTLFSADKTETLGDFKWNLSGNGGYCGFDSKKGQQFGSSKKPYTQLSLETTSEISNVSKIVVNASTASDAKASLVVSVGTKTGTNKTLSTTATDYSYEFDPKVSGVVSINITQTTSKALYIKSISITYESNEPYSISFDANGGTFAEGKGTALENIANGTLTTVTLPTSEELTPLYKYSVFSWSDGTKTYEPGEEVTVSSDTTFTAVYKAPELITIAQALEICEITGNNNTSIAFTVSGRIKKIDKEYSEQYKNITVIITDGTNDLKLFRLSGGADLSEGDEIVATGNLITYNSTPEMNSGCTYVMSSKVECANFIKNETHSSLIVSYDGELNPTNVDLRLGGTITADSYLSGATYGVLVTEGSKELTAGKTTYRTVEEFIAANEGFKNVTCTPARVNESGEEDENGQKYQFAWVLTDMEGHYNTEMTAVMYMIYDGALYICKAKTTSVLGTVGQYLDPNNNFEFTKEQKTVLNNIKA